ncbi:MAG: hypothetical protein AAF039_12825 [Bacteroidota bacterium]
MNFIKTNSVGVDKPIQKIQERLYAALDSLGTINGYGRVYKNKRKNRFVFECYKGNDEYEDITSQDGSNFFCHVEETVDLTDAPQANLNWIFMLNLEHFYNGNIERMDEEIKQVVNASLIRKPFTLSSMVSGPEFVDNLLKGFFDGKSLAQRDMHPYCIFTVRGTVTYNYKNCS